jgi:WD40 repeat protein
MIKFQMITAAVLLLTCFAYGENGTASTMIITDQGEFIETVTGEYMPAAELGPMYDPPEVLWHYTQPTGPVLQMAPMGYGSGYVFAGGYLNCGANMFLGTTGNGSVLWSYRSEGATPTLSTGAFAAKNANIFYAIQTWNNLGQNTSVHCFSGDSDTPVWTYIGTGAIRINYWLDMPGHCACSADGSVFAAAASIDDHLAILFFNPSSSVPFAVYEDENHISSSWLRITADGSKCIFRTGDTLYRVDTATGSLEASYALDGANPCFGISPDGSVVAYGCTAARIAVWDGSAYNLEAVTSVPGYYGGAAAVAADNSTVYFGFFRTDNTTSRIIRYDLDTAAPVWTYDYDVGSGGYQDLIAWMECSNDGRWMVAGSWGSEVGGENEVNVFDDLSPEAPVFTIDTPGSVFYVDISDDGRYVSAAGKHVHANELGSGTDVYMCEIDILGLEGEVSSPSQFTVCPNPSSGSFTFGFTASEPCVASLDVFDLSGRLVHSTAASISDQGTAAMDVSTDLPAGVYTCRLSTGSEENTVRLVIAR